MDRGAVLFGATLFIVLAALTSVASSKFGEPDPNGAVASAFKHHLADFVGMEVIEGKWGSSGPLVLCVESKVPLETEVIERSLEDTVIVPVPVETCTSETIEGDFGMFTAITKYYDATGLEAVHLEVVSVSCSSTSSCIVEIDGPLSGERYRTRREGQVWSVVDRSLRWVV